MARLARPLTSFFYVCAVCSLFPDRKQGVDARAKPAHDAVLAHATARITLPTLSNRVAISASLMISGGVTAMVSPVTRITMSSS
jgi:hypothetical protein